MKSLLSELMSDLALRKRAHTHTQAHTQRKGKRKSERDEEKSIIIKLPANTDKRSAIPLKTHSFQYTNIYTL